MRYTSRIQVKRCHVRAAGWQEKYVSEWRMQGNRQISSRSGKIHVDYGKLKLALASHGEDQWDGEDLGELSPGWHR